MHGEKCYLLHKAWWHLPTECIFLLINFKTKQMYNEHEGKLLMANTHSFKYCLMFCLFANRFKPSRSFFTDRSKIVSKYNQEIPQSQTADNPMAPQGKAT